MDANDLERLLTGLGNTLTTGLGAVLRTSAEAAETRAAADRTAADDRAAADRAALISGLRSGGRERSERYDRKPSEKEDLAASIIKTQSHTVDWLKDNTFNPDEVQITVWKEDVSHKLRSRQCVDPQMRIRAA